MSLDIQDIKNYLPHRFPFLLIDKIIDSPSNTKIKSLKNLSIDEPFFQGHFPTYPIMPGVLVVEAMAQTAAVLILKQTSCEERNNKLFVLGGLKDMRFLKPVYPGSQLIIEVELVKLLSKAALVKAIASCNGEIVAKGTLSFGIIDNKK